LVAKTGGQSPVTGSGLHFSCSGKNWQLSSTPSFVAVDLRVLEGHFGSSGVLLQSTPVTTSLEGGHLGSLGVLVQSTSGDDVF
jgi:hypothetical protein